ncbi:MAG: ferritin [Nitrososphaerota archaeon]|nr:ferritin [Nitrososphaerota archaeon]MDG7048901.1 ferritin [Nitrososphaerota archaeon]MDG7051813.1 ferritin [Nitrososphaerota archaeon]
MPRYEDILHVDQRTAELSRARQSLLEEIEAIMFYDERASATKDETLKAVMKHNRDDEKEHFSLLLEWLRRNDPELERELRENLFSKKPMENLGD